MHRHADILCTSHLRCLAREAASGTLRDPYECVLPCGEQYCGIPVHLMNLPSIVWRGVASHAPWPSFGAIAQTCRGVAAGVTPLTIEKIALTRIDLTALCVRLGGCSIKAARVERVLQASEVDRPFMVWEEFEELVRVQVCLQKFRSMHPAGVTLCDVCTLLLQSSMRSLPTGYDVSAKLLQWLEEDVAPQVLSANVDLRICCLQNTWRQSFVDRCCIGSVVQLLLPFSAYELITGVGGLGPLRRDSRDSCNPPSRHI